MKAKSTTEFLEFLDPLDSASFNIEHYTDTPKGVRKPKIDPLAGRYANLTRQQVEELIPQLQEKNEAGAGIFIARNQCEGNRNKSAITRVRGVHADMDDVSAEELVVLIRRLPPSIVVESSPGRYQLYWQLSEGELLEAAEAKAINQCLASQHGADPAAVDVSRLLRLPGFKHMKYRSEGRTSIVTATYNSVTYTREDLLRAFPPNKVESRSFRQTSCTPQPGRFESQHSYDLARLRLAVATAHPQLWSGDWKSVNRTNGEIGYPSQSEADLALAGYITRICREAGVGEESLPEAVEKVFGSSPVGMVGKWCEREDYRLRTIQKAISEPSVEPRNRAQDEVTLQSFGDIRNAKAFAQIARGQFLYIATRDRWLTWQHDRWCLCEKDEHVAMAKNVCARILEAATKDFARNPEVGKRLVQDSMSAHSLPRIKAMLKLAVSEPDMATTDRELDSDPYLLGVLNGVVDLRTGKHIPNRPALKITKYSNAGYDLDAKCDRWLAFLDQIFQSDQDTIDSVQRLLGYTLIGISTEEILVVCYGHGSNGKSVFNNVISKILGGYSVTSPPSLLTTRRSGDASPRNDLAALSGARYVSINEMQAGDRLDEQIVKILAGREPIAARFLNQEFFEFTPTFTPWLRTNHKPIVTGDEDGIWRRLVLLRFGRQITESERDPSLEQKLLQEMDGILMWMLRGARLFLSSGLSKSAGMSADVVAYRSESDLLGEFLSDHTEINHSGRVSQKFLYVNYKAWCVDSGVRFMSKKSFTQRLAERGFLAGKSGAERSYHGLVFIDPRQSTQGVAMDQIEAKSDQFPF